ncbi:S9 family peptidase [Haladaptatus paucihalophilus]|uniref:Dipeptidyl aminopeptidase/acylaminoacyl peptidase n=1 Tax=Haladaptatus paucihalophilus DX253 TaxID=797209 RepID=A0A1M6TY21_HALPU|nr:prolyl oligopeptidase family serine peptidase [Haladaptatus paucihalophilus]SHK61836.1 Dipeptidyl aminopeptidase/acylaminoacyl peptidase [Haladaptatus paucihalophilus DX253]
MPPSLTISDVLDVEYPGPPAWSADGDFLAATAYEDDGNALFVTDPDGNRSWRFSPEECYVSDFEWSSTNSELLVATDAGELLLADPERRTTERLLSGPEPTESYTWSNDGTRFAFYRDGRPTVRDAETGTERGFDGPKRGPFLGESRMFAWSDDDTYLAYRFVEDETTHVGVIDVESASGQTDELVWRTHGEMANSCPAWLADGRVIFDRRGEGGTMRRIVAADPETGEETVLVEEIDRERGIVSSGAPAVSPDGTKIALSLPLDGWDHVHVVDVTSGERTQLTRGAFEDKGVADATPRWLDDETLVFASNRNDSGQRHLFAVTLDGDTTPLVETPGTNVHPRPAPDGETLAYVHADRARSPELRVSSVVDGEPRRLTRSSVEEWPTAPIDPDRIEFESAGRRIDGYLLDPRKSDSVADDAADLPAVVCVHGGPMRQMRDGWHPSRSYGLFYTYHQYLAAKGYACLFVNYRGGIGYGREFRQAIAGSRGEDEIEDVARAGEFLQSLDYVDADSVAVWGLSYGGYSTLQVLGTHPDTFSLGINLAGLADLELYREWAEETKYPAAVSTEVLRMGGEPWEVPERWDEASPVTHMADYEVPLYNFHGTGDRYVNFEQLDVVVETLTDLGKEFDADHYPGENHVFSKRATWRRTLRKVERVLEDER